MNTRSKLLEIQKLIDRAQLAMASLVESQPKPTPGKPPEPRRSQRIARGIWKDWEKLRAQGTFTAVKVSRIVGEGGDTYLARRSISAFSAILSQWEREGYLEFEQEGRGPLPAIYKIPN